MGLLGMQPLSALQQQIDLFSNSAYTGYIDIEARHLFFYFFESRNDPDKDDVIFWTNGGESKARWSLEAGSRAFQNIRTRWRVVYGTLHGTW
jgi:Serine carboxypeptidase